MKLYICRKPKKNGEGTYLALEARAEWGTILLSFDVAKIMQLMPHGVDHRTLTAEGVQVGELYD